jgi:DNA-binding NarL/FixJ family response regulator
MSIRVLIVEDHESWRRYVTSVLEPNARFEVVGEVADGQEAVQAAKRLQPDLVVLDIGLPTMNGIEAARAIREQAPSSKILFLTEQRSPDVARAALATGAYGYVLKSDAGDELLPAIEAIIDGKRFVSARFANDLLEA